MNAPDVIDAEFRAPAIAEHGAQLATPVMSAQEAREAMQLYAQICESVLTPDDYQEFKERGQVKRFKKKSAVKKLQTFWGVSVTVRDVVRDDLGDGHFGFRCTGVATARNGRTVEATGACSTHEERFDLQRKSWHKTDAEYADACRKARARAYHDVLSTAETRATNRAVMNVIGVGGGEVTADEISRPHRDEPAAPVPQPAANRVAQPDAKAAVIARAVAAGVIPEGGGIDELRAYCADNGIVATPVTVNAHLDALARPRPVQAKETVENDPWQMSDPQRSRLMALHADVGQIAPADRYAFYTRICGRAVGSAKELTKLDYETVTAALRALRAEKAQGEHHA